MNPLSPCPHCTYDLRGLPAGPCPECGRPFDPGTINQQVRDPFCTRRALIAGAVTLLAFVAANALTLIDRHNCTSKYVGFPYDAYLVYSCFDGRQFYWDGLAQDVVVAAISATVVAGFAGYGRRAVQFWLTSR